MLLNLYFENFRSFKKGALLDLLAESSKAKEQNVFLQRINKGTQEEEARLLKSAVIYGANASGKSNLIRGVKDILNFVCNIHIPAAEPILAYTPFAFDIATAAAPVKFAIEFIGREGVRYKYEIHFNEVWVLFENLTYWPQGKPILLIERDVRDASELTQKVKFRNGQKHWELDVFRNQSALSKFGSQEADELLSSVFVYFNTIHIVTLLDTIGGYGEQYEISEKLLADGTLMKKMNELLRFADTGLSAVSITKEERLYKRRITPDGKLDTVKRTTYDVNAAHPVFSNGERVSESASLPFSEESNGVKTLYTFGGRILTTLELGGVIFVDELETSLHPYLSKLLVVLFQSERINKKNAQLIFTTHDTNLLERSIFRRDQIWITQKDEFGATDLYSLQDFPDVREDTPFDKWYLAGKFGGIPDIQSLEKLFENL